MISATSQQAAETGSQSLHWHVAGHFRGIGTVAAAWVNDPDERVEEILLQSGTGATVTLDVSGHTISDAVARHLFKAPDHHQVRHGFIAVMPGPTDDTPRVMLRLENAGMEAHAIKPAGDHRDLAELLERLPIEDALATTALMLRSHRIMAARYRAGTRPEFENLVQSVFDRLGAARQTRIACHIDTAVRVGRLGILLKGWLLTRESDDALGASLVSLHGSRFPIPMPLPRLLRADVLAQELAAEYSRNPACGFVAFAPVEGLEPDERHWFIEFTMRGGLPTRVPLTCGPEPEPMAAIRAIVAMAEPTTVDYNDLFERAIAPALGHFWPRVQAGRGPATRRDFGEPPAEPLVSIIVPLYGRMDFVRHQIAAFSNDPEFRAGAGMVELIYVLDDPSAEQELPMLCRLLHDIYGVAFRLLLLHGNFGYSAANNAGAALARGTFLLLLNSDVVPKHPGWVGQLVKRHETLPRCGVLGCRLLFEDESIQHAGMTFRASPFFADAWTNDHCFKGLSTLFDPHAQPAPVPAVTGACLLIGRALYGELAGLSQSYVIGDFEDSDLCLKVQARDLLVYYTPEVELYHLERQSMKQIAGGHAGWRQSLTFYNMWQHSQRWKTLIAHVQGRQGGQDGQKRNPPIGNIAPEPAPEPASEPQAAAAPDAVAAENTDPARPTLKAFEALGSGHELAVLPKLLLRTPPQFFKFPAESEVLLPCAGPDIVSELPRFSVFGFDTVDLHGFRLFAHGGHLFNDQSLVDESDESSRLFWRKFHAGQAEDVTLNADGMPVAANAPPEELDADGCLLLCSDEPYNYGSWIYRYLAKFVLARPHARAGRVLAYDDSRWMLPVLRLADPEVEIIPQDTRRSYRIRNAAIPSLPAPHVYLRPEIREAFAEIVSRLDTPANLPERIYVSRRKQALMNRGLRVLENETELVEKLACLGFAEFFPEDHDLAFQLAVFAQARIIVSPGGSNLFGSAFAQKADLILDIESADTWLFAHMNLLASTQLPFSVVKGVTTGRGDPIHGNWIVDADAIVEGLRALGI